MGISWKAWRAPENEPSNIACSPRASATSSGVEHCNSASEAAVKPEHAAPDHATGRDEGASPAHDPSTPAAASYGLSNENSDPDAVTTLLESITTNASTSGHDTSASHSINAADLAQLCIQLGLVQQSLGQLDDLITVIARTRQDELNARPNPRLVIGDDGTTYPTNGIDTVAHYLTSMMHNIHNEFEELQQNAESDLNAPAGSITNLLPQSAAAAAALVTANTSSPRRASRRRRRTRRRQTESPALEQRIHSGVFP